MLLRKIFFIGLLFASSLYATPVWFSQPKFYSHDTTYYGYGVGATQARAQADALKSISAQIETRLFSSTDINKEVINDNFKKRIRSSLQTQTQMTIRGAKTLQSERDAKYVYILLEFQYVTPAWYELRSIPEGFFKTTGYGQGASMKEATNQALEDLSNQLSVSIEASFTSDKKVTEQGYTKELKKHLATQTQAALKNAKVIKSDRVGKEFFSAVRQQSLPKLACIEKQNRYLTQTLLIKHLNELLECKYDYKLLHKNSQWHLFYHTIDETLSAQQFEQLLANSATQMLELKASQPFYKEEEPIGLSYKAKKSGFFTLFVSYENGKVGILTQNLPLQKNNTYNFPDEKSTMELIAGLTQDRKETKDLYVAVLSDAPLSLGRFMQVGYDLLTEKEYRFGELIELLDDHDYATLLVRTTP